MIVSKLKSFSSAHLDIVHDKTGGLCLALKLLVSSFSHLHNYIKLSIIIKIFVTCRPRAKMGSSRRPSRNLEKENEAEEPKESVKIPGTDKEINLGWSLLM